MERPVSLRTCDKCGKVLDYVEPIAPCHLPDLFNSSNKRTIVDIVVKVENIEKTFQDNVFNGDVCCACFERDLKPMIEDYESKKVTVLIKNAPK